MDSQRMGYGRIPVAHGSGASGNRGSQWMGYERIPGIMDQGLREIRFTQSIVLDQNKDSYINGLLVTDCYRSVQMDFHVHCT
jgi:hypothetical protein